jgi:hypothetical protein
MIAIGRIALGLLALTWCVEPSAAEWKWVPLTGTGDCTNYDILPYGNGETTPDPSRCNAQNGGRPAICWSTEPCQPGRPLCAYKSIPQGACTGGGCPRELRL